MTVMDDLKQAFRTGEIPTGESFSKFIDVAYNNFMVIPTILPSNPPNSFEQGESILVINYNPTVDLEWAALFGPDVAAGDIFIRTSRYVDSGVTFQEFDTRRNGRYYADKSRVAISETEWGPIQEHPEIISINGKSPDVQGNVVVESAGEQGPIGLPGKDGIDGRDGTNGSAGPQGVPGPIGETGPQGIQGNPGENGDRGLKGDKGDVGPQGSVGLTGPQGSQGPTGSQGIKGDMGNGFAISKVYGSLVELEADFSNPAILENDFVLINSTDEDNGKLYVKTLTAYQFQSQLAGVKGDKGDQGIQGTTGIQGPQGSVGPQGLQGAKGNVGDRGPQGNSFTLKGTLSGEGNLPISAIDGDAYWIGGRLYIWSDNPNEVATPTWLRGSDLTGPSGLQGIQGMQGIQGAQGTTPALVNATTTAKGVVQVGEGLTVSNGIVAVDKTKVNYLALPVTATFQDFPIGISVEFINGNTADAKYLDYFNILQNALGVTYTAGSWFNFVLTTKKNTARAAQTIEVYAYLTSNQSKLFELTRQWNASDLWGPWVPEVVTNLHTGNPNGALNSFQRALVMDRATGTLYRKNSGTGNSADWLAINGPKDYAYYTGSSPAAWTLNANANTRLTMTLIKGVGITNNGNTFTLKGGKTYLVNYSFGVTTTATTGTIRIGIFNSANNVTADGNKITIGTVSGNRGNTGSSTILTPTVDTGYYMGVESNSPAGSFLAYSQTMSIVEI